MVKEFNKKKTQYYVNLYVLTNNYINYAFYEKRLNKIFGARDDVNIDNLSEDEKIVQKKAIRFKYHFLLHILNEANLVSRDFVNKKIEVFENAGIEIVEELGGIKACPGKYSTLTLGFGYTGQQTTLQAYINSANVSTNFEIDGFEADIFDKRMDSIGGIFALQHPLIVCCNNDTPEELEKKKEKIIGEKTKSYLSEKIKNDSDFKLPLFVFHNTSCFNQDFVKFLYKDGDHILAKDYNLIIVALGDDEINIQVANAIISRLNHENQITGKHKIVAVNIFNQKNICRLDAARNSAYLHIIAFGSRETIYSYDYIIRENSFMEYNFRYSVIFHEKELAVEGKSGNNKVLSQFVKKVILNNQPSLNDQDLEDVNTVLSNELKNNKGFIVEQEWRIHLFKKQSNVFAAIFKPIMASFIRSYPADAKSTSDANYLVDKFAFLSCVEHERWSRFHISNGWVYGPKKIDSVREHNCLTSYFELKKDDKINDLINVIIALSLVKKE